MTEIPAVFDDKHRRIQVAPMMELTDRHFRWLMRRLTRHTLLWTEMLTSAAIVHGDRERLLGHSDDGPVVLQLGGSDPAEMADAAAIGESNGYGEININCGCPSDRVKAGRFGACLMAEAELVGQVVARMQSAVRVPVSVKCRLGIDRDDSYDSLERFVHTVAEQGCRYFVVHARKAWLDGLSPKENRTVPPLRYEFVQRLKLRYPSLHITLNGGLSGPDTAYEYLPGLDGIMLGRAAYYTPACMGQVDARHYADLPNGLAPIVSVDDLAAVARDYAVYMQTWLDRGLRASTLTRHVIALFQEVPGARLWRRRLSEGAAHATDVRALVEYALEPVESRQAQFHPDKAS
jgi:tRNA-dihydrouridine synthase A